MLTHNEVVIVIPVYKEFPSNSELRCLEQIFRIFNTKERCLVYPKNMSLAGYTSKNVEFTSCPFPVTYFASISGYNKLMLSSEFYKAFDSFKYILICQLDAWVFHNDLSSWTSKKYDYVGAPWMHNNWGEKVYYFLATSDHWLFKYIFKYLFLLHNKQLRVGNGGLSLRKTSKYLFLTKILKNSISKWPFHEDLFWSLMGVILKPYFVTPHWKEAVSFSFEENPKKCFELNNKTLPLGCHAWEKNDPEFWNTYIS